MVASKSPKPKKTSVNLGGAPRKHDRDQIAKDLIVWAEKENSINLCGFCVEQKLVPQKISEWSKECDKFREAYEYAKICLGERRERLLAEGKLHVKAYDINARTYDRFLYEQHKEEKEFDSKLRSKEEVQNAKTMCQIQKELMSGELKQK